MQTNPSELAIEIAESLDDLEALPLYQDFTERFHEDLLRKILMKVLSIPSDKIKKTRGALFTYLVKNHARYGNRYPRN